MSRLDFAPNLKEIQIMDIKKGLGVFTPKRDKPVSFALLQTSLKKAGYKLDTAEINVSGTLQRDDKGWWIVADPSGQRFALEGATLDKVMAGAVPDTRVEITGDWKTVNVGGTAREVISPVSLRKIAAPKVVAGHKLTFDSESSTVRFGLELPTGKKRAPLPQQLNASDFVRQQLTPINGGLAPHFDLTFSQARKRIIFGGNSEAVIRTARAGFRTGHEVRVNTDLEYVLLPRNYQKPGGELFAILETNFVHCGRGLVNDTVVPESRSTEYYLSPGLQYAAATRFVIEGSYQFPVARKIGSQVLRTDRNVLLGVRYLF